MKGTDMMSIDLLKDGEIAKVILNRPDKLNALTDEMIENLGDIFEELNDDQEIKAVILTGKGRAFCAGVDVGTMGNEDLVSARVRLKHSHRFILSLVNIEKPVIAAVRGACVGLGYSMALACDLIIASDTAIFSHIFKNVGLVPDGGAIYFLTQYLGIGKAKELVYTARMISSQEALDLCLVTKTVNDSQLMNESIKLAQDLANSANLAIGMSKKMFQSMYWPNLETLLETEALVQAQMLMTHDHKEGVQAFLEKRKPNFIGR